MKNILMSLLLACGFAFAMPLSLQAEKVETYNIRYGTAGDGSIMHFGIWDDCVVATVVANAPNIGLQSIMYVDGTILDASTNYSRKKQHFVNKYSWGTVTSSDYKQVIERK